MKTILACLAIFLCAAASAAAQSISFSYAYQETKSFELGDPISAASGAYHFDLPTLSLGGPLPLRYELSYHSHRWTDDYQTGLFGPFSSNHNHTFDSWEERDWFGDWEEWPPDLLGYAFRAMMGREQVFFYIGLEPDAEWEVQANYPVGYRLVETGPHDGDKWYWLLDPLAQQVYIFKRRPGMGEEYFTGWLRYLVDRNGNHLAWEYDSPLDDRLLTRVSDGLGRELLFSYESMPFEIRTDLTIHRRVLTRVADQAGREIVFGYGTFLNTIHNENVPALLSVTDPEGHATTFEYAGRKATARAITQLVRPLGNIPYTQEYERLNFIEGSRPRVTAQEDAYGNRTTLAYDRDAGLVTETRPDGSTVVYRHAHETGLPEKLRDPAGNEALIESQEPRERIAGLTDRAGGEWTWTWHEPTGRPASATDPLGRTTGWTWQAREQVFVNPANDEAVAFTLYDLARIDHPDGTSEVFARDARGNLTAYTGRSGETSTFTWNERGQQLSETNPAGGVTTRTYNEDGTLASVDDGESGPVTFEYDGHLRVIRRARAGGAARLYAWDLNDRLLSVTDENGRVTSAEYDANGNLVRVTHPGGQATEYTYDLMDRRVGLTDRRGQATLFEYDDLDRLAAVTDPTGVRSEFFHDRRGWLGGVTRAGQTWTISRNEEGVPATFTTPLGRVSRDISNAAGEPAGRRDPLGRETEVARDESGFPVSFTDPAGAVTEIHRDAAGRLAGVTRPDGAAIVYERNALGRLARIGDFNENDWFLEYSPQGRLLAVSDPLSRRTEFSYAHGRLSGIAWADGGETAFTRDAAGQVTRTVFADGLEIAYEHDADSRLTATGGLLLTRDAAGQVTGTGDRGRVFGAARDAAGRLAAVTYDDGAFAVNYTWDVGADGTGLLAGVSDTLTGVALTFEHDDDRRLVTTNLPNGGAIIYTWDDADRLTRLQSGAHVDLSLEYDAAGRIASTTLAAPLLPSPGGAPGAFAYDAAGQVSSPGYAYDARGRRTADPGRAYAWDGAGRLAAVNGTVFEYNGLGQPRARTADGQTTNFYYNHALPLAPLVAEQDAADGRFLRYYVWTPGGRLLYMIDAADGNRVYFYHFDQAGSTLALTDSAGEVTDAWAWDPYGRLLARTGDNPQPFTFAGAWGVRREAGGLYQMRARWYDPATAAFLSPEPLWPRTVAPESINPYQYVGGDPLRYADPSGLTRFPTAGPHAVQERINQLDHQLQQSREAEAALPNPMFLDHQIEDHKWDMRRWENNQHNAFEAAAEALHEDGVEAMLDELNKHPQVPGNAHEIFDQMSEEEQQEVLAEMEQLREEMLNAQAHLEDLKEQLEQLREKRRALFRKRVEMYQKLRELLAQMGQLKDLDPRGWERERERDMARREGQPRRDLEGRRWR